MQEIHEFPQEVLLIGRVVAGPARISRTIGTSRTSGAAGTSGSVWVAWLGVVIFVTLVALVCCVSRGIGFASEIFGFRSSQLPPVGCRLRCWGVWVWVFPVSVKYTGPPVV